MMNDLIIYDMPYTDPEVILTGVSYSSDFCDSIAMSLNVVVRISYAQFKLYSYYEFFAGQKLKIRYHDQDMDAQIVNLSKEPLDYMHSCVMNIELYVPNPQQFDNTLEKKTENYNELYKLYEGGLVSAQTVLDDMGADIDLEEIKEEVSGVKKEVRVTRWEILDYD